MQCQPHLISLLPFLNGSFNATSTIWVTRVINNGMQKKSFIPLESDPEIFTDLMHDLGASSNLQFVDVWSLEDDDIGFIPRFVFSMKNKEILHGISLHIMEAESSCG